MKTVLLSLVTPVGIALACLGTFFLIIDSLVFMSFSGQSFFSGQLWRLFTFPFTHISFSHLIENMAALGISILLMLEFELTSRMFIKIFLLSGILVALGTGLAVPLLPIAGASLGIYAVLGSLSIKGSNFIPKYILMPLLLFSIFAMQAVSMLSGQALTIQGMQSSLFHLMGFGAGIALFYILIRAGRKKKILEGFGQFRKKGKGPWEILPSFRRKKRVLRAL